MSNVKEASFMNKSSEAAAAHGLSTMYPFHGSEISKNLHLNRQIATNSLGDDYLVADPNHTSNGITPLLPSSQERQHGRVSRSPRRRHWPI